MNISTTELVITGALVVLLSLMSHRRAPKGVDDIEALRALIRDEVAKMDIQRQQRILDGFTKIQDNE